MGDNEMDDTIREWLNSLRSSCRAFFLPPWGFKDAEEEDLYMAYTMQQRQRVIPRLLAMGMLMQLFGVIVPGVTHVELLVAYMYVAIFTVTNLILAALYFWARSTRTELYEWLVWCVLAIEICESSARRCGDSYNEMLGWAVYLQFFAVATIQTHYIVMISHSILSISLFLVCQYNFSSDPPPDDFYLQQITSGSLLVAATVLGGTVYIGNEVEQRRSFQQTKNSLRDKLTIEQQSKEQERLLLSVLPEHVAVQMRKDLGLIDTQFKKIYMSRHENVSILYADIVGFTAISSTYSAQDLVAILNELFARFDRLAEMYHQLRIKILGDCYYCISGAPVERPDHAILCVHMGLSMVKAIKYVQQTTNSPVDMRVGIHTGAVLAGVLGQRQWQFDVYSRDVELANKMESSGMAGRVHVSEVTLGFLNNQFEVEPAYGERREEMLRQAGIKTYFIVQGAEVAAADALSDQRDDDESSVLSSQDDIMDDQGKKILRMLSDELVQTDDDKELADTTTLCMKFKDADEERGFIWRKDPSMMYVAVPTHFLMPTMFAIASFATPPTWELINAYIAYMVEASLISIIYYSVTRYAQFKKKRLSPYWKLTGGILTTGMFLAINITSLFLCGQFEEEILLQQGSEMELPDGDNRRCLHPSYYFHIGAAVACSVVWVPVPGLRVVLLLTVAVAHALPAIFYPALLRVRPSLDCDPYFKLYNATNITTIYNEELWTMLSHIHDYRNIIMIFFIVIAILIVDRFTESLERARHLRGLRMRAQAEQASDLRRRNLALIRNVLPPHVIGHFIGARHHHRDLYSQSYAEVGVLFASMPNFSEFYSEETVNNQGLECLRFLNEVISDFDLLLEESKFYDIIKIKTIGSTYMAASGLNPKRQIRPSDGMVDRWAHLACLVEFALELQRVLAGINEQSFNHFVLRMGVNHGPITAGVIGARKPHYDIWGNTVNVASRMESTGKAGCIQVTEETCEILQEFGYSFEQRGLVAVKGKGQLMTYYLQGKRDPAGGPVDKYTMEEGSEEAGAGAFDALLAPGSARAGPAAAAAYTDGAYHPLLQR